MATELLGVNRIVRTTMLYAQRLEKARRHFREHPLEAAPQGLRRGMFLNKHVAVKLCVDDGMPPEAIFNNYSVAERRIGPLAVPFVAFRFLPLQTKDRVTLANFAIAQRRFEESSTSFAVVLQYVRQGRERPIRGLMDRYFLYLKDLLKHGIVMVDPKFWNFILERDGGGSKILGFDFGWIEYDLESSKLKQCFENPEWFARTAYETYCDLFEKQPRESLIDFEQRQFDIIERTASYLQRGIRAFWRRSLIERLWGNDFKPVASPFEDS